MSIKIFHLIETLSRGGAEKRLINDLSYLDKNKFSNAVCHIFNGCELKEKIIGLGIPVYNLGLKNHYEFVKAISRLSRIIREFRPDIIHTQLFAADIYGRIMSKLFGIPVISTIQSSAYEPVIEFFRSRKRKWIDSISGRLFNRKFIAVSSFVKTSVIKRLGFPENNIEVIYNYLDDDYFSESQYNRIKLRENLGLKEEEKVLITVGKLNPPKGHSYLFEAMSLVKKHHNRVKLLVVGDGQSMDDLVRLRNELILRDSIVFLGRRDDVRELIFLSDIFVFPSLSEGLPMSLLEAMAMAKPCLAFNLGPMSEIIKDGKTGLLVEPQNPTALAEAILNLITDSNKAFNFGIAAKDSVFNEFGPDKNINKLQTVYESLVE